MELSPARCCSGGWLAYLVSALLVRDVSRRGRLLELSRSRRIWIPDQPAHRFLLRNRYCPHGQSRSRGNDGRVRDDGCGIGPLLPSLHHSRKTLVRPRGQGKFLVVEYRSRLDGLRIPVSARHPTALSLGQRGVFLCTFARIPE